MGTYGIHTGMIRSLAVIGKGAQLITECRCPLRPQHIHPFHIVAILVHLVQKTLPQHFILCKIMLQCMLQSFSCYTFPIIDQSLDRRQRIGQIGNLDHLYTAQIIMSTSTCHIHPPFHAVIDNAG